jgi:hypothetical protein
LNNRFRYAEENITIEKDIKSLLNDKYKVAKQTEEYVERQKPNRRKKQFFNKPILS